MKYIIDVPDDLYVMNGVLHIPWRFGENPAQNWINTGIKTESYYNADAPDIGCTKCKYDDKEAWEEPCRRCNAYLSMWKEKDK